MGRQSKETSPFHYSHFTVWKSIAARVIKNQPKVSDGFYCGGMFYFFLIRRYTHALSTLFYARYEKARLKFQHWVKNKNAYNMRP